jgi:predicted transcriptional regulator
MSTEQKHTTIRVSTVTRDKVAHIAKQEGRPMTAVIDDAVKQYERKQFWDTLREQIERTRREDPEGWADYLAEVEEIQGGPSRSRRIAPEWEGLIDFPKEKDEGFPR